jgi:hypothetical protein
MRVPLDLARVINKYLPKFWSGPFFRAAALHMEDFFSALPVIAYLSA